MKTLLVATLTFFTSTSFAMPTTAQKIDCVKKEIRWVLPEGYALIESSIDLKQSHGATATLVAPFNAISKVVGGDRMQVQFANFAAEKDGKVIKGWVYVFSRNLVPENYVGAVGQCEVQDPVTKKPMSIDLGGHGTY